MKFGNVKMEDIRYLRQELEEFRQLAELLPEKGCWRTAALQQKLYRTAEDLAERLWAITKLIQGMEDAELRLIFELRYFRGYTWAQVAAALPVRLTPDAVRMKHDRFIRKYCQKQRNMIS